MVDNLQFTHTHNDVRLQNFPDESGQNESVAFPECRQQDSSREYLHQQLMRIVRSSASTLTTERKQNNLLLAYHLQLQDLSIREVSKKANNIKKEQLYGKHMKDWMDKEINGPIKEYEKLDRQRRLRRELARTQKQAKKTRLPKIEDHRTASATTNSVSSEHENSELVEQEQKSKGEGATVETAPVEKRRVLFTEQADRVHEVPAQDESRNFTAPTLAILEDATSGDDDYFLPSVIRRGSISEEAANGSGGIEQLRRNSLLQAGGNLEVKEKEEEKVVVDVKAEKKRKAKSFVDRNFCANKNRLFTRYLHAKNTFFRDFTDDQLENTQESHSARMDTNRHMAKKKLSILDNRAPRRGSQLPLGRRGTLNMIDSLKLLNIDDHGEDGSVKSGSRKSSERERHDISRAGKTRTRTI